jgi:glycerol-3-phosphate acyltransferase PlsY
MLVIFPLLTLAMTALWIVLARLTHKASIASIAVAIAFPISVALAGHEWGDVAVITVMALLVIARHLSNLRRLVTGQELGLEGGRQSDDPPDVGDERAAS